MLWTATQIALVGMGVVFVFLLVLYGVLTGMERLQARFPFLAGSVHDASGIAPAASPATVAPMPERKMVQAMKAATEAHHERVQKGVVKTHGNKK